VTPTGTLPLDAAVELAAALALDACEHAAVPGLVIKGIACQQQGLRSPRAVGDVDVLVPPGARDDVAEVLKGRGWLARPEDSDVVTFPRHSITMYHRAWPCDIDLHDRFPGMEADPAVAFESLWAHRSDFVAAGRPLPTVDPASQVVLLALHSLRTLDRRRHDDDLRHLVDLVVGADDGSGHGSAAVLRAATTLGSLGTARPFLERLPTAVDVVEWPAASLEWRLRTLFPDGFRRRFVAVVLGIGPGRVRSLVRAVRAVRADDDTLRKQDISVGSDRDALRRLRLARLRGAGSNLLRLLGSVDRVRAVRSAHRYDALRRRSLETRRG
jgi:hypothetical protein